MNTLEDRVRSALRARAEDFSADPDAWLRLAARRRTGRKRRAPLVRRRWPAAFLVPAAAAAAVAATVVAAVTLAGVAGRPASSTVAAGRGTSRSAVTPTFGPDSPSGPAWSTGAGDSTPTPTPHPSTGPSPLGPYSSSGPADEMLQTDPAASAIIALPVTASARSANRAVGYFWIGYASPRYWLDQITPGPQLCNDIVDVTNGESSGFCWPLPRLGAGQAASVTGNEYVGTGQPVLAGAATAQVTSVAAVLPGGRSFPGVVKTGRGFPVKAWTVSYPQARGVRLVFRDASGREVASLGTAAPHGPPRVAQPRSGGLLVFRYPAGLASQPVMMTAYLIQGRVGFWSRTWGGVISPVPARGGPRVGGLILPFGLPVVPQGTRPEQLEGFGYAQADVARIVLHLPGGGHATAVTFPAWPGSGLRLWAIELSTDISDASRFVTQTTATAYDAAGQVLGRDSLGLIG
jgi:hypothetical protein